MGTLNTWGEFKYLGWAYDAGGGSEVLRRGTDWGRSWNLCGVG